MSAGYTFLGTVVSKEIEPLVTMAAAGGLLCLGGVVAASSLKGASDPLMPERKLSLRTMFEVVLEFIVSLADETMGKENRKYVPFVATIFFFILFLNLLGLIPGVFGPTGQVSINFGVAGVVFIMYNFFGVREVGLVNYVKHFMGPVPAIALAFFVIEMLSHIFRPISLSLRLFGNMTGDHAVVGAFTQLTKFAVPVLFYLLGTFVCMVQAYVFSLLTMVYIGGAVTHDHDDHGHDSDGRGHDPHNRKDGHGKEHH